MFLQWQLEWQHKYPQIILPAAQKPTAENITNLQNTISSITNGASNNATTFLVTQSSRAPTPVIQPPTPQPRPPSSPPQNVSEPQPSPQVTPTPSTSSPTPTTNTSVKVLTKLEDMKVSDLKMELKKRNLPVSGPKPQLIERLKPFAQNSNSANGQNQTTSEANGSIVTTTVTSGGRTISVSSTDNPGSVLSEMDVAVSPSNQTGSEEDEGNLSPVSAKATTNCSPPPPSPVPSAMDTSEPSPPSSPNVSIKKNFSPPKIIVVKQKRKIIIKIKGVKPF